MPLSRPECAVAAIVTLKEHSSEVRLAKRTENAVAREIVLRGASLARLVTQERGAPQMIELADTSEESLES